MIFRRHPRWLPKRFAPRLLPSYPQNSSHPLPLTLSCRLLTRLSPLECAVTSKHRVLPGFGRNCPPATPLECAVTKKWGEGVQSVGDDSLFARCEHHILWRPKRLFQFVVAKTSSHTDSSAPRDFPISLFEFRTSRALAEYRTLPSFLASWCRPRADAVNDVRRKPLQSGEQPKRFGPEKRRRQRSQWRRLSQERERKTHVLPAEQGSTLRLRV